jgi:nucleotide-binding universal stress UspA family protein
MQPIVCATRGGESSRHTQEKAIELAQEQGAPLFFLYVADPDFAGPLSDEMQAAVVDELKRLGRALLSIAQSRAERAGLRAHMEVRCCGTVQDMIAGYLQEVEASTLVIGAPRRSSISPVFDPRRMDRFAEAIHRATGVKVVVVE